MEYAIFDFHFHLLFKHYLSQELPIDESFVTNGMAKVLNDVFGGPFDSQSSPKQIKNSRLRLGVTSLLSLEHAFANRMLHILDGNFESFLSFNKELFVNTRNGNTTYFAEFTNQVKFYKERKEQLKALGIEFTGRHDYKDKTKEDVLKDMKTKEGNGKKVCQLVFSIEGGHNLSDVPIRGKLVSRTPEFNLQFIQDRKGEFSDIDFISINLCHLSYIPEQPLGGFAQGLNKVMQIAFSSEDFMPKTGLGLTQLGKKVIRQALTHPERPLLIDVKHMSVYTRFHYYRFRESLIDEDPAISRLPIISSHTGFTFSSMADYLEEKRFVSDTATEYGVKVCTVQSENRYIGKTNDKVNSGLFSNPWTINLFDEEIVSIMRSRGMIGLSLDQWILGADKIMDSSRNCYFEAECIAKEEWEKLFKETRLPVKEKLAGLIKDIAPSRAERHVMLLCMHLIYAVRIGNEQLVWLQGTSPWDHLCIGSDFDGLVNPVNRLDNIEKLSGLEDNLRKYLPIADQYLCTGELENGAAARSLKYNADKSIDTGYLESVIEKFMYTNGVDFTARFLSNWKS